MRITYLFILFIIYNIPLFAQKEQTYWYSGVRHGMKFENGVRQILPVHPDSSAGNFSYTNSHHASMSDNNTGNFLFQANGARVLDKNFAEMPGGKTISTATFTMAVQNNSNSSKYHLIYADKTTLYYAEIDMNLRGGLGDVVFYNRVLKTNAVDYFTIVRTQDGGAGYWIITHTIGNNEYEVFKINSTDVISTSSSKSNLGNSVFAPNYAFKQGNMVSNKTGTLIAHTYGSVYVYNSWFTDILKFDKCAGKLELHKQIPVLVANSSVVQVSTAFSKTDKYLYSSVVHQSSEGLNQEIFKYDYTDTNPVTNSTSIAVIDSASVFSSRQIALAPDGDIYITSYPTIQPTPSARYWRVSVISQTESSNPIFIENMFTPFPLTIDSYSPWFPSFLMDTLTNKPPLINVQFGCLNDSASFQAIGFSIFDSVFWSLGNGKTKHDFVFKHLYNKPGKYQVDFKWFSCGRKEIQQKTIDIGPLPLVNFGPDTTLCPGTKYLLNTEKGLTDYLWSTGDKTENLIVEKEGTYWAVAKRGDCQNTDTIKIDYQPPIWIELGDEFYLCEDDNQAVKLDAGKGYDKYLWTPTGDTTQWIEVKKSGPYYVVVKDFRGCNGEDGTIVKRKCDIEIEVPNAFTPNGDGLNDLFAPFITDAIKYELTVYNRWGEKLFYTNNQQNGWDGNYKQNPAQTDIYMFTLRYSGYQNKVLRKYNKTGTFHLLR